MIHLRNVRKEKNIIKADYYPEGSNLFSQIEYDCVKKIFKGNLVGSDLETRSHLAHAKYALKQMNEGKREIKDCQIMWYWYHN